jgi:ribose-phosphate pyrophosphokinase
LDDSVRGKDCFVIQPICGQVNDNLVELLLMVSTLRRASAIRITAVIPYFGYARQDRKFMSRVPISAADVAVMLDQMGVDRVIAVDLHSGQIQGFFPPSIPVDNLDSSQFGVLYFSDIDDLKAPCVVSPDGSSVGLGKEFRDQLTRQFIKQDNPTSVDLAMLIPESHNEGMRLQPAAYSCVQPPKLDLVGTVENKDCIIVQDIIDTGDTIVTAAKELKRRGARQVFAFAPHGLFSGEAAQHIADSELQRVVVTNTTPMYQRSDVIATGKVQHLSLAPMLAEAILRVHSHDSVSDLFKR